MGDELVSDRPIKVKSTAEPLDWHELVEEEKAKQEEKNSPSQKSEYFVLYSYRYDGDDVCYQARNENLI